PHVHAEHDPHESPLSMTIPLIILAACAALLGFIGTPLWPWFQKFLGHEAKGGFTPMVLALMAASTIVVIVGIALGWSLYGRKSIERADQTDPLQPILRDFFTLFRRKYFIDELYEATVIRFNAWFARVSDFFDAIV